MKCLLFPKCLLLLIVLLSNLTLAAQEFMQCPADSLQLDRRELEDNTFIRLHFRTFASPSSIAGQEVIHTYAVGGDVIMEVKPVEDNMVNFFLLSLAGSHEFKVINTCLNGDQHEGTTMYVNFTLEEDLFCPPITDLVIDEFNNDFIAFSWADTSIHIEYEVGYQPGVEPEVITGGVADPMFEQNLSDAIVHTFSIVAICDDPGPPRDVVRSPVVRFSVITIDDIKLLQEQRDSVIAALPRAFRINTCCTEFLNTVNKGDVLNNLDDFILDPDSCTLAEICVTTNDFYGPGQYLEQLRIFPNPAQEKAWVTYDLPAAQRVRVDLLNLDGHLVDQALFEGRQASGRNQLSFSLTGKTPGLYLLRIQGENFQDFAKVLVH